MFLLVVAGRFCLLSYWLLGVIRAFPSGFLIPFRNCLEAFELSISQQLFYALLAVSSGFGKTEQFLSIFLEATLFHFVGAHFVKE